MCGIAGFYFLIRDRGERRVPDLEPMVRSIRHRGPDGEGFYRAGEAGLGACRLSIIDLEGGRQPLANETGDVHVVYNGEIYNFGEIRRELEQLGHRFATRCDTEVLVHGYEQWGEELLPRLRGMFAFAVLDERGDEAPSMLIARDPFGIKPLYYAELGDLLIFGSEIKSLLATGLVSREIDFDALDAYLSFLAVPEPRTLFAKIRALPPGHLLAVRPASLETRRYWRFEPGRERFASRRDAVETTREVFEDSVRAMLAADVPLGLFLSAGLDSASILAMMSRHAERPVRTFTIGFGADEHRWDEMEEARRLAVKFETEHHELRVDPDIVSLVPEVVDCFDQPFANPTAVILYLLAGETKRYVKVILAGTGGDELFAGYPRYLGMLWYERYRHVPQPVRRAAARVAARLLRDGAEGRPSVERLRRFLEAGALSFDGCYSRIVSALDEDGKGSLYAAALLELTKPMDASSHLRGLLGEGDGDPVERLMGADLETYLPFNQLAYADRMSMARSLEMRVPFVDQRMVEVAGRIPLRWKLAGGRTKSLFRETMAPNLPRAIIRGPKRGLNLPIALWFRGKLEPWLRDQLAERRVARRGYFRPEAVRNLIDEHATGRRDHSLALWSLVIFEAWHQRYLD